MKRKSTSSSLDTKKLGYQVRKKSPQQTSPSDKSLLDFYKPIKEEKSDFSDWINTKKLKLSVSDDGQSSPKPFINLQKTEPNSRINTNINFNKDKIRCSTDYLSDFGITEEEKIEKPLQQVPKAEEIKQDVPKLQTNTQDVKKPLSQISLVDEEEEEDKNGDKNEDEEDDFEIFRELEKSLTLPSTKGIDCNIYLEDQEGFLDDGEDGLECSKLQKEENSVDVNMNLNDIKEEEDNNEGSHEDFQATKVKQSKARTYEKNGTKVFEWTGYATGRDNPKNSVEVWCCDFEKFLDMVPDGWIDILLCDPPYAVHCSPLDKENDPASDKKKKKKTKKTVKETMAPTHWDSLPKEQFIDKIVNRVISEKLKQKMNPKGVGLIHTADRYVSHWIERVEQVGFHKKRTIKIIRSNPWMSYGIGGNEGKLWDLVHCSEDVVFFTVQKTDFHINWVKQNTLKAMKDWVIYSYHKRYISKKGVSHPTQKPLPLLKKLLSLFWFPGANVCDFFVGSGSMPVVCKKLHFNFKGSEINPAFWELASERIVRSSYVDDIKVLD
eukprot:TRINITY_DN173_c0_g1_i1.p1 TRINITY_DN173_c0_g1~~TRINITY_DN173_c0_g1_i1.p1  ORF type:complete len:550 (-),score=154.84 TRINITY_DN173_c0_g1_i1:244-1893(-)